MTTDHLADFLESSAARHPDHVAVVDSDGRTLNYAELNRQADALAAHLAAQGVRPGDRVGVVLPKSLASVVSVFGIMKAGAAYVPVDCNAPAERARRILDDCRIRSAIVDARGLAAVPPEQDGACLCGVVVVGPYDTHTDLDVCSFEHATAGGQEPPRLTRSRDDLAYILYTSGSTGTPKGVMLTHGNAVSFVDWCSSVFEPTSADRFSSHAPFHFDLSVLDLYVAFKHGASVHLISETLGKSPKDLARFITARRLTVWYSTPSILTLLLQFGDLRSDDVPDLRLVLFAGEVFPVKHLRELKRCWPEPTYFNLYGPTETNVCTFARIPDTIPADRDTPYPIGPLCSHCEGVVLDDDGRVVPEGGEGLLYISGPSVFGGYWNRPVENEKAFVERDGRRWYNTGDVVRWIHDEGFLYAGRKDRMVKRRGYRIELGEIERALYAHPSLREVAVVAVPDQDAGTRIVAFVARHEGQPAPSIVALKTFCGTKIPSYMSPDAFVFAPRLPKTSTDKIDYQNLKGQLLAAAG